VSGHTHSVDLTRPFLDFGIPFASTTGISRSSAGSSRPASSRVPHRPGSRSDGERRRARARYDLVIFPGHGVRHRARARPSSRASQTSRQSRLPRREQHVLHVRVESPADDEGPLWRDRAARSDARRRPYSLEHGAVQAPFVFTGAAQAPWLFAGPDWRTARRSPLRIEIDGRGRRVTPGTIVPGPDPEPAGRAFSRDDLLRDGPPGAKVFAAGPSIPATATTRLSRRSR